MPQFNTPSSQYSQELRLNRIDGGVNYKYQEMLLNDNQSPYMLNLNADDRGALVKRYGHFTLHTFSEGPIHAMISYDNEIVVAHGTKLTAYAESGDVETLLRSNLSNVKGCFFIMNSKLYYLNGAQYVEYDGANCVEVETKAYVPILTMGRTYQGGGNPFEDWNLLGNKFKDSFSTTAGQKVYPLSLTNIDNTYEPIVTLNGTVLAVTTGFTVNYTTGCITLVNDPLDGTDNLVIQAQKTHTGLKERVTECKYAVVYGGASDTRVFLAGNSDMANVRWRSGLNDPTNSIFAPYYWPENSFDVIGDSTPITGYSTIGDKLITFKERSIYYSYYYMNDTTGDISFPTFLINNAIGCDIPGSIQLIDNYPVFANTYGGVYYIVNTNVKDERSVRPISGNINGAQYRAGLLDETKSNLTAATSIDFAGKYYICVGSKVWLWDYKLSPYAGNDEALTWFYYENINANSWLVIDRGLYFGDRATGVLHKFWTALADDTTAINGVWKSKLLSFDMPDWYKNVLEIWLNTRNINGSEISIKYYGDDSSVILNTQTISANRTNSFSWSNFHWDKFTWRVAKSIPPIHTKPKIKKIVYFQVEVSNNKPGENLSILNLVLKYALTKKVK